MQKPREGIGRDQAVLYKIHVCAPFCVRRLQNVSTGVQTYMWAY